MYTELTKIAEAVGVMTHPEPQPEPAPQPDLTGRAVVTVFAIIIGLTLILAMWQGGWL